MLPSILRKLKASNILNLPHHHFYSIQSAVLQPSSLKVNFSNNGTFSYPFVYLQDNCTCPQCFHPSSKSRLRKLTDLKLKSKIVNVKVTPTSSSIQCTWDDGHESSFSEEWLLERNFSEENLRRRKRVPRDDIQYVGSDLVMDQFGFQEVLQNPVKMLEMLKLLASKGVVMLNGAERETGQLRKLADSIGFLRVTHYGQEFTVKSEPNAVNLAYTSARLNVHTDLPYYVYPPGVQLLHCITQYSQGVGGESHLVDGFNVAEQMRKLHPEHYKVLCEVPVEFYDIGKDYIDFFKVHSSPTFVTHPENDKQLVRLVYSNQVLSSYMPVPEEQVDVVYEALKIFTDKCYEKDNLIEFKMTEGQVLIFDNWRMLHGREGFDPSTGHRHLEGCYIDWDEIYSRINVIQNKFNSD